MSQQANTEMGADYAAVVWRRYQPQHPSASLPADTRILAYRLDTRLILIYPDATEAHELMTQQAGPGDYVGVLVAGSAVARFGSAFFVLPAEKFSQVWGVESEGQS